EASLAPTPTLPGLIEKEEVTRFSTQPSRSRLPDDWHAFIEEFSGSVHVIRVGRPHARHTFVPSVPQQQFTICGVQFLSAHSSSACSRARMRLNDEKTSFHTGIWYAVQSFFPVLKHPGLRRDSNNPTKEERCLPRAPHAPLHSLSWPCCICQFSARAPMRRLLC